MSGERTVERPDGEATSPRDEPIALGEVRVATFAPAWAALLAFVGGIGACFFAFAGMHG